MHKEKFKLTNEIDINQIRNSNAKYIGKNVIYFKTIDSTHIKAKELATNKVKNGTIIIAGEQTNGIGTRGRNWYTGNQNIAMTIILYPKCGIEKLDLITIKIAECMKETIKELYEIDLTIKKPNDLLLNNKKICGILTQIASKNDDIEYLLISIGFNVNEDKFPDDIEKIATSLKKEYNKEFSVERIICRFIEILERNTQFIN